MDISSLYEYLLKVQAVTKIGLLYSSDPYAIHNYQELQVMTMKLLEQIQDVSLDRNNYFERHIYPTPNISVRTIVYNKDNQFLMVKEKDDGGYSFPGGWADLFDSPKEAAIREVKEEAGALTGDLSLVGITNRTPFKSKTSVPEYCIFFKAMFKGFNGNHDHEIVEVKWFSLNNLPELSPKVTKEEIVRMIEAFINNKIIVD